MNKHRVDRIFPRYRGQEWVDARLPEETEAWVDGRWKSLRRRSSGHKRTCERLHNLVAGQAWRWPRRPVYFITDIHADADALNASLVASGSIRKTGPGDGEFRLRKAARDARFVIGGDCFDKGPDNLRLLRMLRRLYKRGGDLRLLAGNHDVRVMLGMRSVGRYRNPGNQHFFVRMGPKSIPLITEILEHYGHRADLKNLPSNNQCRKLLYPTAQWFDQFPSLVGDVLSAENIKRELGRITRKIDRFEHICDASGLTMKQVYAAVLTWQHLFLQPRGEFYWFFDRMRLFHRQGSFLFIHAGLDDRVAEWIRGRGVKQLNRRFRKLLRQDDLSFYYSPIANSIRTKYRAADYPLSHRGARLAHESGLHVIVHGHRNVYHGQRISLRKNMINFECDTTMDSGSRAKEGLKGAGAGVTIIHPDKLILGISSDYRRAKVFDPVSFASPEGHQ